MRLVRVIPLLLAALIAPAASARQIPGPGAERDRILATFPHDLDVVVVINEAARQRATPRGGAIGALLRDCGVPGESSLHAWATLSGLLGMSGERAFDELLGRRLTVVVRGAVRGQPRWALLSEITPEVELALRRGLRPAPREIAGGLPVLTLEDGAFELTISPAPPGGWATLLLAPAGGSDLFDDMLPVLRRGRDNAGPRPPDVFVLVKAGLLRRSAVADVDGE